MGSGTLDLYPPRGKNELNEADSDQYTEIPGNETGPRSAVKQGDPKKTTPQNGLSACKAGKQGKQSIETIAPFPEDDPVQKDDSDDLFSPGELIENTYKILYVLGSGSMGVVYLAEDVSLKRKVAIKVLARAFQKEDSVAKKFHSEAVAMAKVRHPNVVQIFSFGEHSGHSYFVMEYIKGASLDELVETYNKKDDLIDLSEAVGLLTQACRGVSAIHKQGIVHRDLKPANILLDEEYRVSVVDFGLVKTIESVDGRSLELDGTPMYLAPERIRSTQLGKNQAHLCDIYSLGCIFYEVLTGSPPYESESVLTVLDCHLVEEPPNPLLARPELPTTVQWVINKAMAKDPAKRFQSCIELETALNDARTGRISVSRGPRSTLEACTILLFLVIDPDEDTRKYFVSILKRRYPNARIQEASEGEEGLGLALNLKPALIICHADTPNKNALEICARLGSEPADSRPIILVTDKKPDPLTKRLYREIGAEDMIIRRPSPESFIEKLSALLQQKTAHHD